MSEKDKLLFNDFYVGQQLPSITRTVTREDIEKYVTVVGETNAIYRDDEAARRAGFEGVVAPPMMVKDYAHFTNVLLELEKPAPAHSIHARSEYTYVKPARPGDVMTTTGIIAEKYERKGRKYITFELTTVNQKGETIVVNRHTSVWPK